MLLPGVSDVAFVGFARAAFGAVPPVAELQSRWLALLWSGEASAPSEHAMRADIEDAVASAKERYPTDYQRVSTLVDYRATLDGWGELLGWR